MIIPNKFTLFAQPYWLFLFFFLFLENSIKEAFGKLTESLEHGRFSDPGASHKCIWSNDLRWWHPWLLIVILIINTCIAQGKLLVFLDRCQ